MHYCLSYVFNSCSIYILMFIQIITVENPFNLLPMFAMSEGIQNEVEKQVVMMSEMPPMP